MSQRPLKIPYFGIVNRARFFVWVALVPVALSCRMPSNSTVTGPAPVSLRQGWSYAWEIAPGKITSFQSLELSRFPPGPPIFLQEKRLILRRDLPSVEYADAGLYLTGVLEVFDVYLDGRRIYRFGMGDNGKGGFIGYPWHIIPIPPGAGGRVLEFHVYSEQPDTGPYGEVLYGSRSDLYAHILAASASRGVLGVFFLLLGVFVVFVFLPSPRMRTYSLSFAAFLFLMGMYVASRTPLRLFFIPFSEFWLWTYLFSLYMLPVAFGAFVDLSFSGDGGLIRRVWILGLVWGGTSFLVSLTRLAHWHSLTVAYYPLVAVTGVLGLVLPVRRALQRDQDARIFLWGLAAFFIFAMFDYMVGIGWLPYANSTVHFGMFLLVCSIGVILMRRQSRLAHEMTHVSAELHAMQREIEITHMIHLSLFPSHPPAVGGLTWAIDYLPSARVGGDFYDFAESAEGIAILLVDVTGHGIPAAVFASGVKMAFALEQEKINDPAAVLQNMGRSLYGRVGDQLLTACCTFLDLKACRIIHASAGHMPLLVWKARTKELVSIKPKGRLMGFEPELLCVNATEKLEVGDRIILYTDGLVEAVNDSREMFGEDRLANLIRETAEDSIEELRYRLRDRLQSWNGGRLPLEDDLTFLVVQITACP